MAQPIFSMFYFLFGLLLNESLMCSSFYSLVWMVYDKNIYFCLGLFDLFQGLVWISSVIKLMMVERYFGLVYVFSMILLSDLRLPKEQSSRKYRRNSLTATIHVFDERLMIFNGIRIYVHLVMFYYQWIHNIL